MKFSFLVILMAVACSGVPSHEQTRPVAAPSPPAIGAGEIETMLRDLFDETSLVPGMAVVVVQGDEILYVGGMGVERAGLDAPVTADTLFYIASSTKSFTGLAAAILASRDVWSLDDPISRHLPELQLPTSLDPDAITIRDLLAHRSRLRNDAVIFRTAYSGDHDREGLIELLESSEAIAPGFKYGNIGYVVTSLAIDAVAEGTWKDVLEREIFQPAGMTSTSARRSTLPEDRLAQPHGVGTDTAFELRRYIKQDENMHAAGGVITSAADLARWLELNLNQGRIDGVQVVPAAAVRESHALQVETDAKFHEFHRTGYGLGWYHSDYGGDFVLHHFGNYPGFRAHVSLMPEHGLGIAVLTNESSRGYFVPEVVALSIYDLLLAKPDAGQRRHQRIQFLMNDAASVLASVEKDRKQRMTRPEEVELPNSTYVGTYLDERLGELEIVEQEGRLVARVGLLESRMEPVNDRDVFRVELIPGSGQQIGFKLEGDRAIAVVYDGATFKLME